jgi:hypothetical protein
MAIMNLDDDEEIVGGWATPHIPEVGIYKLLAKKPRDGSIEWAHFIQRESGSKDKVIRGTVKDREELQGVIDAANLNLGRIFGVTLQDSGYSAYTLDGRRASPTVH